MSEPERPPRKDTSHAMLIRLPHDMLARLTAEARERTLPLATAARVLLKERLDQLDGGGGDDH